jgi:hypothetical protein
VYHNADHLADELLDIVLACRQHATAEHVSGEAVELRTGPRGFGLRKDDVPVKDVAGERDFDIVRRRVQVGKLDCRADAGDRRDGGGTVGVSG